MREQQSSTGTTTPTEPTRARRTNWGTRIGFRLRPGSSSLVSHLLKTRSHRPSSEEVKQWSQSLDLLLGHKYGKAAFHVFLKSEFCEENIEFWTACEDLRALSSPQEAASKARSIYQEFVRSEAPKEINLDFYTKDAISRGLEAPDIGSFLAAQKKVYGLMETNSYPRFIHSDLYRDLCVAARRKEKHKLAVRA